MSRVLAMLRTREVWPAVEAELQRLGVAYRLTTGGKHPIAVIEIDGQTRRLPIASSPNTRGQTVRKTVCQARRLVASLRAAAHG